MLFFVFCSALTVSLAIFRSDKSDVQQNSFGAVVLHDNSQYKYKSKIQNKLVGEEYLFNDVKLTVADNTSPVFIRAHVYFDSTNEVAKDKIKFNSFSIKNHENYTWSRFGDYWYLCDKSGNLMQLNSTKAGEVYVFLIQSDAVVPEMHGVLGDDEFVSCEIVVQSSLASNFSNTTNFSEINKSFDKNATETTKTGTYSVVFKQNGATLSTQTINYGGKASIPEVTTAEGDVFLCWNTREDGSGANITNEQLGYITQNLTLFPMFENQKVLVTVVQSEGGTISPETQMVDWGSDLVMHFTPNKNYVLKRILIDGDPVGATSEYLLKRITGAVVVSAEFVSDYIVLDINGGAGEQPNVVYNGDQTKFMLEGNEPTKSGKEFYYYSTNSADNEQGQNGHRYDLGYWYDVPNTSGTTTLFAIYLTPSSNYQTAQNYVVVPKNVSAIADSAVNMFSGTNNTVKFVTLPRQTSKIGKNAFANCSGLVGVSMSDFVTSIGESAFKSDSALTNFRAPTSLQTLSQAAFSGCASLSKVKNLDATGITEIPSDCFAGCSKLEEIVLPANISKIRPGAFGSSGLKTINLEDTKLEELGDSAFNSCAALTQVTVPSTLKTMGQAVFMFSGITEVKNFAGTSVSKIESTAFWYSSLIQIELPETLEIIDNLAFASCSELTRVGGLQNTKVTQIVDSAFSGCSKLKNVIFPQTLLTLGGSAYSGCSALTSVTFNSNLTTIGANAFEGCSSLSQLTGLEKTVVATIGDSAFKDCTSLVDVSFPNTIQTIGANAFANCSGLATINFINDSNLSTLSVATNSFTGTTSDLKVNILDESHFDEYISKLNGKGFAENAFMFFLGNIDRKAHYKNAVWEKFHDAVITSTAGEHGTISPSGAVVYSLGSSASYVISPETGYKIKKILVDGVEIVVTAADGAAQSYEFVDIQKDHTISAEFEQRMFKITVVCGGNGKIEPSTTKDYAYGSEVAFVITPNDGYVIKDVLIDGVSNAKAKENAKYTFSNLRANHKIEVSFEVVTFTIVSSVGEGGTMSPNQITTIKNWGENHSVTYTPNDKFVISTIVVDGQALNLSEDVVSKPYTYTFSNITANHVISCQFESTQRTLTYDPNGGTFVFNTDIDLPSSTDNYNYRTIAKIGLVPKTTYTINFASATLISGTATEFHVRLYKFGNPSTHYAFIKVPFGTNVSAVFTSPETLNPSDNNQILVYAGLAGATAGNNVSLRGITMSVTKTLTWNSVCGVSPTPTREGYNFKGWSTESEGSAQDFSNKKYSSVFGKEDGWLYAIWEIKQFTITTEAGAHGTITESMTVDWGTTATVEMKPDEGYRVATYSIDGGNAINSTAKAGDSDYFTFRNITANHTISVTFAPITYTIKYNGNGATSGSTANSSHTYDEEKELTPNGFSRTGYNFAGWATKDAIAATNATAVTNGTTMTGNVGSGSDSIGTYFTKNASSSTQWWAGLACSNYYVTAGKTYIWTIEVYHEMGKTIRNQMDANVLYTGATNNDDGYGGSAVITPQQIPSGVWTTLTIRVKIIAGVANPYICHSFCPTNYVDGTKFETAAKIYYRNSRIVEFATNPPEYMNCEKVKNLSAEQGKVVELFAVWAANQYTVTFNPNGGTVSPTSQAAVYDSAYGALPTPTRTGYAFGGWIGGKNLVNNNIQQNGWSGSSTTVNVSTGKYTFRTTPGSGTGSAWRSFYVDVSAYVGKKVSISGKISAVSPSGATLSYIKVGQGNAGQYPYHIADSSDSKTISNSGSFSHTCTIISGTSIMGICIWMNATSAGGYVDVTVENLQIEVAETATSFESPNQSVGSSTIVKTARDHTLYAQWTPNKYNIKFQANDATITEQLWDYAGSAGYTSSNAGSYSKYKHNNSRTAELNEANYITFDGQLSFYTPIPIRLGHTFKGWYSAASGEVKVANSDGSLVANVSGFTGANKEWKSAKETTLYAQWTTNEYLVDYVLNGGTKGSTPPSKYTFGTNTTISDPTRTGYTFTGWSVVATLDGKRYGTIHYDTGVLQYASDYPSAVYFPLFYQQAGVQYTGKLGNGSIRWRQYSTAGAYAGNAGESQTNTTNEAKYLSLWYYSGMSDSSTTLSWNGGKSFKIDANQVGKLTLTANWTANTYTVTANANGGTIPTTTGWTIASGSKTATKTVTYDSTYGTLPTPTRTGYTFAGWSKNMFNPNLTYGYSSCTRNGETFTFDTGSQNSSSLFFEVQYGNNTEYLSSVYSSSSTGICSGVFNKNSSTTQLRFKYNGNKADACFYYDVSDLPDGKYVIQVNITTMQMNKIVIKNVMIEQNANNTRTSYVSSSTHVSSGTKVNDPFNRTLFAEWTPNKYTVTFDPNCKGGLISSQTSDGTYSGNNMTITYTASTHEYKLVNVTSNDPFAQIGQTVYLTANTTYLMHAEVYNSSGSVIPASSGSIQIFYAIGGAYNEGNSRHFYANTTYQTFTVPTTGTYNIRIDNDCGQTVRVRKFWIYRNFTYQKTVTYGEAYGTLPTGLQANGCSFVKWNSSSSGGSTVSSSTIVTTASNHTVYGAWSGQLTITVNSSSYYSNVRYSTSSGQSGSIANGSSVNLVNVLSTDKVTITATAIKYQVVCDSNRSYWRYYGFKLNGNYVLSAYNETNEPKDVSLTIDVTDNMRSISVTKYTKTKDSCCVAEDSLISMADGTQKQIKDIKVGDKVLSYNTTTRKIEQTVVQSLTKVIRQDIVHITFADGTMLKITPDHPMFSERGWIAYSTADGENTYPEVELEKQGTQIGDLILSLSLLFDKEIVDMKYITGEKIPVYTFTVEDNHNYFAQSVLIHNGPVIPCILLCCVDGETDITMADGTTKKAKDIKVGDEVLSYNDETKQYEKTTIEETINPYREKILEITFEDGSTLKITDDHPLLSARGWICYNTELGQMAYGTHGVSDKAMQVGDKIITETGAKTIASIKVIEFEDLEMVYTFRLANGLAFIANGNIVASVIK